MVTSKHNILPWDQTARLNSCQHSLGALSLSCSKLQLTAPAHSPQEQWGGGSSPTAAGGKKSSCSKTLGLFNSPPSPGRPEAVTETPQHQRESKALYTQGLTRSTCIRSLPMNNLTGIASTSILNNCIFKLPSQNSSQIQNIAGNRFAYLPINHVTHSYPQLHASPLYMIEVQVVHYSQNKRAHRQTTCAPIGRNQIYLIGGITFKIINN